MKILFLSQRIPYPPNRGDKITTWRLIDRMRRDHEVTCVAFAHGEADLQAAGQLNAMGITTHPVRHRERFKRLVSLPLLLSKRPLTLGVYGSRELQAIVDRLLPDMDMAYAYSSSMGAFLESHPGKPRVMHFGELDSDKWRQYVERTSFPMSWVYRREWRTLLKFEHRLANDFFENVFCTPLEQKIFQEQIPGVSSIVLRNGVDLDYFRPAPQEAEAEHLVFTGVMNYFPNTDGCRFFVRDVLPRIRAEFPKARFTIVGSNPSPEVRNLAKTPGVEVTGFVADTRDFLRRATIAVAPLRIARGIQNKVLEAMAMGLPVVGTTCATQGVEAQGGRDYLVEDDAVGLARAVCTLLREPQRAAELRVHARGFVEANYDWEVVLETLDGILGRIADQLPSSEVSLPARALRASGNARTIAAMSHEAIARTFDEWAQNGRAEGMEQGHADVVRQVIAEMGISAGEQILDLGCGNGWGTRLLAQGAPGASAVGVDVSSAMVARAEELHELTIRARYQVATFEDLGFKDGKFNRVFSMEALYYAVELDAALSELHRVLKSGGVADVVVDRYKERADTESWSAIMGLEMAFLSESEWVEAFERAGFKEVRARRVVDSRGPGDPKDFEPSEHHPDWETALAMHSAGSLWIHANKPREQT